MDIIKSFTEFKQKHFLVISNQFNIDVLKLCQEHANYKYIIFKIYSNCYYDKSLISTAGYAIDLDGGFLCIHILLVIKENNLYICFCVNKNPNYLYSDLNFLLLDYFNIIDEEYSLIDKVKHYICDLPSIKSIYTYKSIHSNLCCDNAILIDYYYNSYENSTDLIYNKFYIKDWVLFTKYCIKKNLLEISLIPFQVEDSFKDYVHYLKTSLNILNTTNDFKNQDYKIINAILHLSTDIYSKPILKLNGFVPTPLKSISHIPITNREKLFFYTIDKFLCPYQHTDAYNITLETSINHNLFFYKRIAHLVNYIEKIYNVTFTFSDQELLSTAISDLKHIPDLINVDFLKNKNIKLIYNSIKLIVCSNPEITFTSSFSLSISSIDRIEYTHPQDVILILCCIKEQYYLLHMYLKDYFKL